MAIFERLSDLLKANVNDYAWTRQKIQKKW